MFSDTTTRIVTTAFLLDPRELLELLSVVSKAEAEARRHLDLTYEAHRWNDLSVKLENLSESL